MVDDVEIKNVGGKYGVASEATLSLLVDALTRGGAGGSGGSRAARAEALARESNARAIKKEAGERSLLGKVSGATIEPLGRLAKEFIAGGNRMGDFTQAVFGAQSSITSIVRSLDSTIDTFRELTSVGAGFNNSMYDFIKTSALTGMSLSDFSQFIIKNSTSMIGLGGTVTEGAKRFGDISKNLRTNFGPQLTRVGMTMTEMNDVLLEYTEFSIGRMGKETRSNRQLAAGAATYSLELDKLAKLTGISRKQLAADQQKQLADQRVRVAMTQMSEQQQINMSNGLTYADTYSRSLGDSLRDMIDNVPDTDDTKGLMVMSETFRTQAANIKNMTAEEMANFTAAVGNEIDAFSASHPIDQLRNSSLFSNTIGIGAELRKVTDLTAEQRKKMLEEQAAYDRLTASFLNFETALNNLKTFILNEIIASPAFKELEKLGVQIADSFSKLFGSEATPGSAANASSSFKKLTDVLIGPDGLITKGIKGLQTELTTFTDYIKNGGSPMEYFKQKVGDLGTAMYTWMRDLFYGTQTTKQVPSGTVTVGQAGLFDRMASAFESFWDSDMMTSLKDTIAGYFKDLIRTMQDTFVNSPFVATFLGIERGEVTTRQAEEALAARQAGKPVSKIDSENALTEILGKGWFNTSNIGLLGGSQDKVDPAIIEDILKQVNPDDYWTTGGAIQDALQKLGDKYAAGTASEEEQILFEKAAAAFVKAEEQMSTEPPAATYGPGFADGTNGFENFGTVTGTSLHGVEAVVPRNTAAGNMLASTFKNDWNNPAPASSSSGGGQETLVKMVGQLNNTMVMLLNEMKTNNALEKRTLNSVRSLSGDLNRGI